MILPLVCLIFQIIGLKELIKKNNIKFLILIFGPIIIHFIFSYFRLYPFDTRLLFYLMPNIIILFLIGVLKISNSWVFYFFNGIYIVSFILNFPFKQDEIKPHLAYVNENLKDNEVLYVFKDLENVIKFYKNDFKRTLNIKNTQIKYGTYLGTDKENLNKDISNLQGLKGYLLFGNVNNLESRKSPLDFNLDILLGSQYLVTDETIFIDQLLHLSVKLIKSTKDASLYYFDLSILPNN